MAAPQSCNFGWRISTAWSYQLVKDRLREAAETLNSLLELDPDGFSLPFLTTDGRTERGRAPSQLPRSDAVDRMCEVLTWMTWLEPDVARLAWTRAQGSSWKAMAFSLGVSVRTAQRQRRYAVSAILWRLHGRRIPRTWSRQFLLERVAALSRGI